MKSMASVIPVVVNGYAAEGDWAQTSKTPTDTWIPYALWSPMFGGHTGGAFFWCPPSKRRSYRSSARLAAWARNRRLHRRARR